MRKSELFSDEEEWMLGEDIPSMDFQITQLWANSFVNNLSKACGRNYKKVLVVIKGYDLAFWYSKKDSESFSEFVFNKIKEDPDFGPELNTKIVNYSEELKKLCKKSNDLLETSLSNEDLARMYEEIYRIHFDMYAWGWLPNASDVFHGNFTSYLKNILEHKSKVKSVNEYLVSLSFSTMPSPIQEERYSLLRLAELKRLNGDSDIYRERLKEHTRKYFYLKYQWLGEEGVYTEDYYDIEVSKILEGDNLPDVLLKQETGDFENSVVMREKDIEILNLTERESALVDVYSDFALTKIIRRDAQLYWAYTVGEIIKELQTKLDVTEKEARFLRAGEIIESLHLGYITEELRGELKLRTEYCVYYLEQGKDIFIYGDEAREIEESVTKEVVHSTDEISGQTACLGLMRGIVRIINIPKDMEKMEDGDILVSIATNPDIVPAMKKAGAIVTEQGGITSHAAIVARELKVPCVIGTKIATKVLRDGDLVEVDANNAKVRVLKRGLN